MPNAAGRLPDPRARILARSQPATEESEASQKIARVIACDHAVDRLTDLLDRSVILIGSRETVRRSPSHPGHPRKRRREKVGRQCGLQNLFDRRAVNIVRARRAPAWGGPTVAARLHGFEQVDHVGAVSPRSGRIRWSAAFRSRGSAQQPRQQIWPGKDPPPVELRFHLVDHLPDLALWVNDRLGRIRGILRFAFRWWCDPCRHASHATSEPPIAGSMK